MRRSGQNSRFLILSALTVGAFLAENLLYFSLSVPYMKCLSAGAPLLDMRLGYSANAAYDLLTVLGQTGRSAYLNLLWTVDLLLPALFALFLCSLIRRGALRKWYAIPLLAGLSDYAENITITTLLVRYPVHEPRSVQLASVFTLTKLALYASSLVLAVAGFLVRHSKTSSAL